MKILLIGLVVFLGWSAHCRQTLPPAPPEPPPVVEPPPPPPHIDLPRLTVHGQFLRQGTAPWTAIEASDFNLAARYLNGEDIEPILEQRASLGYNLLRVWTLYNLAGIGRLVPADVPNYYPRLIDFLQVCARHGVYVEFTAYTSLNDPAHWPRLIGAIMTETNVLLELVNERDQPANMTDPFGRVMDLSLFARPPGPLLSSHGSNGSEARPVEPFWDYATFHTNDAFEWPRKVGHNAWELWGGPTIANENTRAPDHFNSPQQAFDAAAGAALLAAGSAFHSVHGKTSELWSDVELDVARAWAAGAQSVPLVCQDGAYHHRIDLEGPGDLRVYQRGDDPVCIVRIRR